MSAAEGGEQGPRETFNPWTVVNLVFHHLADNGLHPVLGETGDPAVPATALLRSMGIEPGRNDESVTSADGAGRAGRPARPLPRREVGLRTRAKAAFARSNFADAAFARFGHAPTARR